MSPRKFDFDDNLVQQSLVDFRKVVMSDAQKEIMDVIAGFLSQHIDMYPNVLRSFVHISISMWQNKEKKLLIEITDQSPDIRYQTVEEISKFLKQLLIGFLKNISQKEDLENAIISALKMYQETWAAR